MNMYTTITIVVILNIGLFWALYSVINNKYKEKKIEKVKKSLLSVEINSVMEQWKNKVKIVPMADGRIKIDFPEPVLDTDIFFYLSQEDDKVIISDHGEIVKNMNMNRTMNKMTLKRLHNMFGVTYNSKTKCLYLETDMDSLGGEMWTMFFALILLENNKY